MKLSKSLVVYYNTGRARGSQALFLKVYIKFFNVSRETLYGIYYVHRCQPCYVDSITVWRLWAYGVVFSVVPKGYSDTCHLFI